MIAIREHVPLAALTSYRIGGEARRYCTPRSSEEIITALQFGAAENLPVQLLGKGSNVLVSDDGFDGLVIDTSCFDALGFDGNEVCAAGGALLHTLVREAISRSLGGCAELAGIPGTVGGAVIMNAGAFSQTISDCLESVELVDRSGAHHERLEKKDLWFGYRESSVRSRDQIVLSATFRFPAQDAALLKTRYEETLAKRREKQPLDLPNCGSVFKRPPGNYAGTLIEQCGLKGIRLGGAQVSDKHANFIVNRDAATAADVRGVIVMVQRRVFEQTGVLLSPEVVFVGTFQEPLYTCH